MGMGGLRGPSTGTHPRAVYIQHSAEDETGDVEEGDLDAADPGYVG